MNRCVWLFGVHTSHSQGLSSASTSCLLQMSSISNLQVSHPLEKPSAACPTGFRRGWRETFKVIPHRLLNKPFILSASQNSLLHTAASIHNEQASSGEEEEGERRRCLVSWTASVSAVLWLHPGRPSAWSRNYEIRVVLNYSRKSHDQEMTTVKKNQNNKKNKQQKTADTFK